MPERPVPMLVPPDHVERAQIEPIRLPLVPHNSTPAALTVGIAAIDHSGRLRERTVLAALQWHPGDYVSIEVQPHTILLHHDKSGRFHVDDRGQVFIPAGTRALFGLATGDRVTLVAAPGHDLLLVHPMSVVSGLFAEHYRPAGDDPHG